MTGNDIEIVDVRSTKRENIAGLALTSAKDGTLTRINKRGILLKDFILFPLSLFRDIEEVVVVYRYYVQGKGSEERIERVSTADSVTSRRIMNRNSTWH